MQQRLKRLVPTLLVGVLAAGLVAGCAQTKAPAATPPGTQAPPPAAGDTTVIPAGYPPEYKQIIADSKKEGGLTVYSNMAEFNWKPVLEGFNKVYPWIKVQTLDLGSGEVFERYLSEKASGAKTADLLVSASPDQFLDLVKTRQDAVIYESPEKGKLPNWGAPMPGLYTVSADPMILIYNKKLLAEGLRPNGLTNLAELAEKNPTVFNGKITTYDISSAFGYAINWAYARDRGDGAWKALEKIGPMAKPEKSGGPMVEKVTSGEYVAGYFVSGITFFPKAEQLKDIVGWSYIKDGAPMFLRGVVIPKAGKNVNAAKMLVDFMLSHDGQVALGKGGVVPYRTDVKAEEVPRSYQTIVKEIGGEDKAVLINYDEKSASGQAGFVDKWKKAFKR